MIRIREAIADIIKMIGVFIFSPEGDDGWYSWFDSRHGSSHACRSSNTRQMDEPVSIANPSMQKSALH